jgi:hypothetical protein
MVLGSLDLIGTNQFQIIHLIGVGFVISISIKCLELGKEVENLKARNNKLKNKDSSITLN